MERDKELDLRISRFVAMFEMVFEEDWPHTKACMESPDVFIDPEGTFLCPLHDDESNNWGARKGLLETYRKLVEVMMARDIYGLEEPGFGEPPPDIEK
jgi:hypothetical protein